MANKRLFYAIKQAGLKPDGSADPFDTIFGVQEVSVSTNFNLTQIFEFGQLEIYEQVEELPDVEISVTKIFDGKPLIWHLATKEDSGTPTPAPDLAGRSNAKSIFALSLFPDTNDSATGTPNSIMECSGLFPRTISYTFPADGSPFTESVTFVGNDKIFSTDSRIVAGNDAATRAAALSYDGVFTSSDVPSGVERSSSLQWDTSVTSVDINGAVADKDATILPVDVEGITSSGTNEVSDGAYGASIQNISISTDLGRESLNELGRRGPYHRYATFPVEVTCSIEAISKQGENISATEEGILTTGVGCDALNSNLANGTIRIATCGGVRIYLGNKNRLSSVDFGGGTTDGGNDTNTYNFSNFNDFTVMAQYDPHASGTTWWTNRADYLVDT